MNIAFDASAILGPMSKDRGIGNYSYSLFKKMIEIDRENNYYFFNVFEEFYMEGVAEQGNIVDIFLFSGKSMELFADEDYNGICGDIVKNFLVQNQIDIFFITSPFDNYVGCYQKEWFEGVRTIATVYDIIPYVFKKRYLADKMGYKRYMKQIEMLRWVDEYLVISQSVKNDLISYLNFPAEHIHVIYGAADPKIYHQVHMSTQEIHKLFQKYQIHDKYIMCTGGDDERKNIEGLIRAYSKMRQDLIKDYQLIIVCKLSSQSVEKYRCIIQEQKLEERVILTNFVSTDDLVCLYNQATLMAFPSLYEGLGLPVLEAWMCGTPVLTSNNSSLGEIGKDAAILVDASNISSITKGLETALSESDLEVLLQKGRKKLKYFNWETVANAALTVINSMRQADDSVGRTVKVKKIAIFTPLPPIQSGISDYSVDIISQLERKYEIDVYIDKYKADFEEKENVHVYFAKEFEKRHTQYDRIIYQVGGSLYHQYIFPYIRKYSGIVVLHDYNLRTVLEAMYLYESNEPQKFIKYMLEDYDQKEVDEYMKHLNTAFTSRYEVNGFVTNYSEKIIVHSEYAKKKLLEKDISRDVSIVPHYAIPDNHIDIEKIREGLNIEKDCVVFAAFGHIHETKRIIPALTAFGRFCKENPSMNAKFYFVGKMYKELEEKFNARVQEYNLEEKVYVTGYISLNDFLKYLDAADVCVNLRYPYFGETSGSLMRSLAKGKCVIVNRIGSFSEIPENACIMLDNVADINEIEEIEQIYQAMNLAMDDSIRKKIQTEAKKFAETYLDLEKVGKQYIQLIEMKRIDRGLNEEKLKTFAEKYVSGYTDKEIESIAETFAYSLNCSKTNYNKNKGGGNYKFKSQICKQEQLESAEFQAMFHELKFVPPNKIPLHRKSWEFFYITLALQERGMLKSGKRGLGFAVGTEPLPAYFASKGCDILATDLGIEDVNSNDWIASGQNAGGNINLLNENHICPENIFIEKVKYRDVDMNNIPNDLRGYDFCWSSCAIEHVGSLEKSKQFVKNMLKVLKPGGVAVHTTEYNLSSDIDTLVDGNSVIYRKKDILELANWLRKEGHEIDLDFSLGQSEGDLFTDQPPYYQISKRYHLRLNLGGYDSTSIGLIIKKAKDNSV